LAHARASTKTDANTATDCENLLFIGNSCEKNSSGCFQLSIDGEADTDRNHGPEEREETGENHRHSNFQEPSTCFHGPTITSTHRARNLLGDSTELFVMVLRA